ncbi:MAG: DUF2156 domain-containing protein [Lachnospiraceae bacterium]|nr:DUF2156 domain-containing protein [Lachnospiraceae bacterium]
MEEFQAIAIYHRDGIERLRRTYGHRLSSHLFASLFIWKETMKLSVLLREELFAVRIGEYRDERYFFPVGSDEAKESFLREARKRGGTIRLYYMRQEDVEYMRQHFPNEFTCEEDLDAREYLYDREEQTALAGSENKYIRHKLRQFEKSGNWQTEPLTKENLFRARKVIEQWGDFHSEDGSHYADMSAAGLLLDYFEELSCTGCLVHDGERDYSVVIGSDISEEIHDMHLAKCAEPIVGLDYYIKQEYYRMLPERIRTINLEEDLGIEGLRTYKERLHPSGYNNIWKGKLSYEKGVGYQR